MRATVDLLPPDGGWTLSAMSVVALESVSVLRGGLLVLDAVDLRVGVGERLGVTGPNGAGKTTLLGVVAGLVAPNTGTVETLKESVGWSGHEPALYDDLTVGENLTHVARLTGIDDSAVTRSLAEVGLTGAVDRPISACSNGMKRRTDLARLLMTKPRLVLLDEATAGLDEAAVVVVDEIVRRSVASGGAALIVSHDPAHLAGRTDRVVRIEAGRLR